jgi:hypothetical protein
LGGWIRSRNSGARFLLEGQVDEMVDLRQLYGLGQEEIKIAEGK